MTFVLAVTAGVVIGLSLGALGGGGSILAVPVLVYALGQGPAQATTGSLVVVGVTSLVGAVTAHRAGNVLLGRGLVFGVVALGGATAGAKASAHVPDAVLLAAFAVERFSALLQRLKHQLVNVERAMGVLMIVTGIAFLTGTITHVSIWMLETFPALAKFG